MKPFTRLVSYQRKYPNNYRLHQIMEEYDLHRRDVARLTYQYIGPKGQTPGITQWLADPDKRQTFREMREAFLKLLELQLQLLTESHPAAYPAAELEGAPDYAAILKRAQKARSEKAAERRGEAPGN